MIDDRFFVSYCVRNSCKKKDMRRGDVDYWVLIACGKEILLTYLSLKCLKSLQIVYLSTRSYGF